MTTIPVPRETLVQVLDALSGRWKGVADTAAVFNASHAIQALLDAPSEPKPTMFAVVVAQRKWDDLRSDGYRMQHLCFARGEVVGTIDAWGKVMWLESKAKETP